jgi:ribosome-associated protein
MGKRIDTVKDSTMDLKRNILYALQDKKAADIVELDMSKLGIALFDKFIICTATSTTHAEALFDNVLMTVKKNLGIFPKQTEGVGNSQWILVDFFDMMVHIFLAESRNFYNIEGLWKDAERIEYNELIERRDFSK